MSLKTIKESVGAKGVNIPSDVVTVQYLLNCIPYSQGGPKQELFVNGIMTDSTIQAINRFQQFHLGQTSGQIESNDSTLNMLKKFDPLPSTPWVVTPDFKPSPNDISRAGSLEKIDGIFKRTVGSISSIDVHMKRTMDAISIEGVFKRTIGK